MIIGSQINQDYIVVNTEKKVYHLTQDTNPNFFIIKDALKAGDYELAEDYLDVESSITKFGDGKLIVKDNVVEYEGRRVPNVLEGYILRMIEEGFTVEPLIAFLSNLYQNPSSRSVNELFKFLEANAMPITNDGCFLAYKFVRDDYTDWHSGTISNVVGSVVEMERNQVDDDKSRTCSTGLHICSLPYVKGWLCRNDSLRVMVAKINPADVVSVPTDYNNTKMRCCRYEIVSELDRDQFDFTDPDFEGAFDTIVDREYNDVNVDDNDDIVDEFDDFDDGYNEGEQETSTPVKKDDELDDYSRGLKHGTIARNRGSVFSPSAPRTARGHFGPGYNEYMAGYRKGFDGAEDFFASFQDDTFGLHDVDWPSDEEIFKIRGSENGDSYYLLGLKHSIIARNRGINNINESNMRFPDNEDYTEGYDDGFHGWVDFSQAWKEAQE